MRPEIQALRALAVLLVVAYHVWPSAVPGGFIGVDVFFVISGFLITAHLLREVERTGTLSLTAFWARRARRLLPAALLVLLLCTIATILVVPETRWAQFLAEVRASTAYVENWHLAAAAVDYLAAANDPSPVQHFWSLSAEEQFYLVWPLVILAAIGIARRRAPRVRRRCIAGALVTLTLVSLAYSLHATATNPDGAYFMTPTRAWEFGAGGLLALAGAAATRRTGVRTALSWAGIGAIAAAAVAYSDATPFPGYTALLPVLGTLAVIWAGAPRSAWAPTPILRLTPVQFIGDVSYSVYLWHWPLLVLSAFVLDRASDTTTRCAIVALTILAAWLTKLLVEDPVRAGAFLTRRPARWTFGFATAATVVVMGLTVGGVAHLQRQIRMAERATAATVAAQPRCFGAAARAPGRQCVNRTLRLTVVPTPIEAQRTGYACAVVERRGTITVCGFGAPHGRDGGTVALIGDSHAAHWRPALDVVARAKGWRGLSVTRTGCPLSRAVARLPGRAGARCAEWNRAVPGWLARHPEVSTVFVAAHTGGAVAVPPGMSGFAAQVAGYTKAWRAMPPSVRRIVVIRDTPTMRGDTLDCVQRAMAGRRPAGAVCAVPRRDALDADPAAEAAVRLRSPGVGLVDVNDLLCGRRECHPVIGGALVYKDEDHLTPLFGTTLGRLLVRRLGPLSRAPRPSTVAATR